MRFEYSPEKDGPEIAKAEAQRQIAIQLERIADQLEQTETGGKSDT